MALQLHEELIGLVDGKRNQLIDVFRMDLDRKHLRLKTAAFAGSADDVWIKKVVPDTMASLAGAEWTIEGEQARFYFGKGKVVDRAGPVSRKQELVLVRIKKHRHEPLTLIERGLNCLKEAGFVGRHHLVDDHLDGVHAIALKIEAVVKRSELAVDTSLAKAVFKKILKQLEVLAFSAADYGRENSGTGRPLLLPPLHYRIHHFFRTHFLDVPAARRTVRTANARE